MTEKEQKNNIQKQNFTTQTQKAVANAQKAVTNAPKVATNQQVGASQQARTVVFQNVNGQNGRAHSYNAGLPKNFVQKKKMQNKNREQNLQTEKQNGNQTTNNAMAENEPKITDVNSRTLNQFIHLDKPKQRQNKNALRIMFLGGVGEIGKNMMALEYGKDIIVVDCGATFPSVEDMPGIDLVVPDITYLIQNKNRIKGIVITHGHEDHIGAIPYVVEDVNVPIYGSKLAVALIQNKLKEFPKLKAKLNTVKPKEVIKLGAFSVEFINVCHSIAGSFAMAITCPAGLMVHTGDFKIDYTPLNNNFTDLTRFAELGTKGVMLLTSESTNVEREGYSISEKAVGKTLDDLFSKYRDKRIFVATFASNVYRLQELLDIAQKYGRKVTFTGRSMQNVTETAYKIGELKFDRNLFIDIDKVNYYKDSELLIVTTGSQGEPMSALTRMASGDFQKIKLDENDCIIFSSSPIPGNEKSVNNVINNLCKLGCTIIYDQLAEVHASGHAYREELKLIHYLLKPKFFMPVHGEFRHQKLHKDLAVSMGEEERNILLPAIGDVVEVTNRGIKKAGIIPSGNRLVDGLGYGELESVVLRDRKQLSEDGIAVVIMGMNKMGEITSGPEIISRGLVYNGEDTLVKEAKQYIVDMINANPEKQTDYAIIKNDVRRALGNFFFRKTKRRPMVLAFVFEN